MPTILVLLGWRLFFYANEGNEPAHVHCRKGDKECKFWIDEDNFDIHEAYSYGMSPRDNNEKQASPSRKRSLRERYTFSRCRWKTNSTRAKRHFSSTSKSKERRTKGIRGITFGIWYLLALN